MENFSDIGRIIKWTTEVAQEAAAYAKDFGEDLDSEVSMGLWQSFQTTFPKASWVGNYDLAVCVFDETYKSAIRACYEALTDSSAQSTEILPEADEEGPEAQKYLLTATGEFYAHVSATSKEEALDKPNERIGTGP